MFGKAPNAIYILQFFPPISCAGFLSKFGDIMQSIFKMLNLNVLNRRGGDGIGSIVSELGMKRLYFDRPRWQWKRIRFRDASEWFRKRLNPHIVIVGESGSGKSNACKLIVKGLVRSGARVAILDPHNEYMGIADSIGAEVYDAAHSGINIFEPDGMSEKEKSSEIVGLFKRVFRLGDVQGYQLYRALTFTYNRLGSYGKLPNIHDLLYTFEIFKKHCSSGEIHVLDGLSRRLSLLDSGAFSKSTDMKRVMESNSIFLLSGLHTGEAQSVYLDGFLRKVYGTMLMRGKNGNARFCIVIDEAEKLGQRSMAGRLAAEGRKYGIGLIAMAQRSKSIDREIRVNASLFMSFYQREPEELNYIANMVSGGNELNRFVEVKRALRNLRMGSALVLDSSRNNPVIAKFRLSSDGGTCLAYEIMQAARSCVPSCELLDAVSVKGFTAGAVAAKLDGMIASGAISAYEVRERCIYDGTWYIAAPKNTPEHEVCVGILKRHLESLGIRCIVYNSSYGPDVIAFEGRERIAVEYETGSKSRESTEKMLAYRNRIYPKVLMVVNDVVIGAYSGLSGARVMSLREFLETKSMNGVFMPASA